MKSLNDEQLIGDSSIRLRRAASLISLPRGREITVQNFITRQAYVSTPLGLSILMSADDWQPTSHFFGALEGYAAQSVANQLVRLVELGALVVEGSGAAARDEEYRLRWRWGPTAGAYHFSVRDSLYATEEQARHFLSEQVAVETSPQLFRRHLDGDAIELATIKRDQGIWHTLENRRSNREFSGDPIELDRLGALLFAGFGVTGFIEDSILGKMPLTMSPSGGARNPFEGYVVVRAVDRLTPGVYHYSGFDHSVRLIGPGPIPPLGKLLADQEWADNASAIILLVANLARTMWKYHSPGGYRVVMIEAGHIGQNIQLAGTEQSLLTAPTCALRESVIEELLGIDAIDEAVVYAIAVGAR
jgi:SagB-type dehydrogenase family enzyme